LFTPCTEPSFYSIFEKNRGEWSPFSSVFPNLVGVSELERQKEGSESVFPTKLGKQRRMVAILLCEVGVSELERQKEGSESHAKKLDRSRERVRQRTCVCVCV